MELNLFFWSFVYSFLAAVLGGAALTYLFFWIKEKKYPLPNVTGRWFFEVHTFKSAYNPYLGMKLRYVALLWLEGNCIRGTVEKIYEVSTKNVGEFIGSNRTRGVVQGYIEKNYFKDDRVILHVIEDGHGRESTNFYEMPVANKSLMRFGKFTSMVADQEGIVTWRKEPF